MPPFSPDDQFKFLISCIRHSLHGKIDFASVARECSIVSKGAASKRYERMMRSHGISSQASSKTSQIPNRGMNGPWSLGAKGASSTSMNMNIGPRSSTTTTLLPTSTATTRGGSGASAAAKPSRANNLTSNSSPRTGIRGGGGGNSRFKGRTARSTDLQPAKKRRISIPASNLHDDDDEIFAPPAPLKLEPPSSPLPSGEPISTSFPLPANISPTNHEGVGTTSRPVHQHSTMLGSQHSQRSRSGNMKMPQLLSTQDATALMAYYEPVSISATEPEPQPVGTMQNPVLVGDGNDEALAAGDGRLGGYASYFGA